MLVTDMFLIKVMKATAVILFLAVCGAVSANSTPQPGECLITEDSGIVQLALRCIGKENLCDENCVSFLCNYYKDNAYPSSCVTKEVDTCQTMNVPVPAACGAPALSAIKGLLVAVLLLAALIVA